MRFGLSKDQEKAFILFTKEEYHFALQMIATIVFADKESVKNATRFCEKLHTLYYGEQKLLPAPPPKPELTLIVNHDYVEEEEDDNH